MDLLSGSSAVVVVVLRRPRNDLRRLTVAEEGRSETKNSVLHLYLIDQGSPKPTEMFYINFTNDNLYHHYRSTSRECNL